MTLDNVTNGVSSPIDVIETNATVVDPTLRSQTQMQLDALSRELAELHADFNTYRVQTNVTLSYILASLQALHAHPQPRISFRWWWEPRHPEAP